MKVLWKCWGNELKLQINLIRIFKVKSHFFVHSAVCSAFSVEAVLFIYLFFKNSFPKNKILAVSTCLHLNLEPFF